MPRLYVFVFLVSASLCCGFAAAWKVQAWRYTALEHERQSQQQRDTLKRIERADEAAASHEDFKAKEEIRYVERIKVVRTYIDRPVYRQQCIDDAGLRDINSAIRGDPASQPSSTLPATAKP